MKKMALMLAVIILSISCFGCGSSDLHIRSIRTNGGSFYPRYFYAVTSEFKSLIPDGEFYYVTDSPVNNYTIEESYIYVGNENTPLTLSLDPNYDTVTPSFTDKGNTYLASGCSNDTYGSFITKDVLEGWKRTAAVEVPKNDDFVITYDSYYNDDKEIRRPFVFNFSFPDRWQNYLKETHEWDNDKDSIVWSPYEFEIPFENGVPKDIVIKDAYAIKTAERLAKEYIEEDNYSFSQPLIRFGDWEGSSLKQEAIDHITVKYSNGEKKVIISLK